MLVGIAKLAAESPLLDAKSQVEYFEIQARSIFNRTKPNMPFAWTINPYRGCEFGCKYCYARYTHEFMGMDSTRSEEELAEYTHFFLLVSIDQALSWTARCGRAACALAGSPPDRPGQEALISGLLIH